MDAFEPLEHVDGASKIADDEGNWPNFHDAKIRKVFLDAGDTRPDDNVWIGPSIEILFDLQALEQPITTTLKFTDCDRVTLNDFNHSNDIYELAFEFEERGFFTNGTPLPPYIRVRIVAGFGAALEFVCLRAEVVSRGKCGAS